MYEHFKPRKSNSASPLVNHQSRAAHVGNQDVNEKKTGRSYTETCVGTEPSAALSQDWCLVSMWWKLSMPYRTSGNGKEFSWKRKLYPTIIAFKRQLCTAHFRLFLENVFRHHFIERNMRTLHNMDQITAKSNSPHGTYLSVKIKVHVCIVQLYDGWTHSSSSRAGKVMVITSDANS